jgi:high-affinity iron transporter
VLFILPFITVLREGLAAFSRKATAKTDFTFFLGMEAVIFVGGVSLGQSATSIPIAAIVGLVCGVIIGFFIYEFASRTSKYFNFANNQTWYSKISPSNQL